MAESPEVIEEPVGVTASFDENGTVVPHSFRWRGFTYAILEVGRTWRDEDAEDPAQHFLVLSSAGERFELLFHPARAAWTIERRWRVRRFT